MTIRFIVLAAGKGTRMKSALPKVLHRLAEKPLLGHVLDTAFSLDPASVTVVIGHGAELVKETIAQPVNWALQTEQMGTGHAVMQGLDGIEQDDIVLVTYGDVPLTRASTYKKLLDSASSDEMSLLTLIMDDPTGYGRILRNDSGDVIGIVEQKDASPSELKIREGNAGVIAVAGGHLKQLLSAIDNNNAQNEYYLTDIFALAHAQGIKINTVHPDDAWEVDGVNSRIQLAELERVHQRQISTQLMESGVTLADPSRLDVRGSLKTGTDSLIDINCVFVGECEIGSNVVIGPNCQIINSMIADGTTVLANCVIEDSVVGTNCDIGPFARIRPGCHLANGVKIGNFCETKKAIIGEGSKVNHLTYIGDADIGKDVNVGAGTITCNYDGAFKHQTTIEDDVFIGSNSALVAPITIKQGATVGAGSTLSSDAPPEQLTLNRSKQISLSGWKRPRKKR
ncbi:MAG: bifunctional UDP-N-acetylglucosamine diphosphorylase/glucosamine-1-phosphate N-acetyltransferase GlmU [Gammaproteobacteria bacterium]|nr:bifunctional UDP-N-acetylglucosamine diphosphorylase/glucosamine-1-phosphate N-acetyltransferase GlmU [Gammaproteobacteria bacterium]